MPIYEYACEKCNKQLEIIQKITEEPLSVCPECKGRLRKMISNTSFVLKGTGWYVTDYASKKGITEKNCKVDKEKESKTPAPDTATKSKEPAAPST